MDEDAPDERKASNSTAVTKHKGYSSKIEGSSFVQAESGGKQNRLSWRTGSWRGKASAVAEIARESIPGTAANATTKPHEAPKDPAHRLSQSLGSPGKSKASPASATPLTVSSDASSEERGERSCEKNAQDGEANKEEVEKQATGESQGAVAQKNDNIEPQSNRERPRSTTGWRGWWTRSAQDGQKADKPDHESHPSIKPDIVDRNQAHLPSTIDGSSSSAQMETENSGQSTMTSKTSDTSPTTANDASSAQTNRSSWFGLWGSTAQTSDQTSQGERKASGSKGASLEPSHSNVDASPEPSQASTTTETVQSQLTTRPVSGSWAFWSRERPTQQSKSNGAKNEQTREVGELAVSGTESQSKPRPAQLGEKSEVAPEELSKKRQRPDSLEMQASRSKKKAADKQPTITTEVRKDVQNYSDAPTAMQQSVLRTTFEPPKAKARNVSKGSTIVVPPPNAIFPSFADTYPIAQPASYLSRISRYFPYTSAGSEPKHLYRVPQPYRIRRALAIGVHGYFPAALIQRVLGPPTGTSIKFADSAAAAIQQYCSLHAYTASIEKVALEGEGTVDQRIENLWKLLLNWIDTIRQSDFILVGCHSQGVPVAVGLVARLLSFGCIQKDARIGVCAMAGVSQGPFASYQSRFLPLGNSGTELFEFAQPNSPVSTSYTSNLNTCLQHSVRVLYIGSLDDQLVSLESSTFSSANHPCISRAVFVDGREHPSAGDFLTRLVGFGLKLRNLGISDHGLIKELSGPLAGSLYSGEGHSRIYEDDAVYDLAVRLTAETDTLDSSNNPRLEVNKKLAESAESNPFFLPWALRGVLEEETVKRDMKLETEQLLGLFEQWRPQSRTLKDVRFRLEAVRSKL